VAMRALNPSPKQSATTSMRRSRKRLPASAFSAWDRKVRVDELKIRLAERDRRQATDSAIRLKNRPAFDRAATLLNGGFFLPPTFTHLLHCRRFLAFVP